MTVELDPRDGPIHEFFGLSYANYLTVPRSLLQSMPLEWQEQFTALLWEMWAHFGNPTVPEYRVHSVLNGRYQSDPLAPYRHQKILTAEDVKELLR